MKTNHPALMFQVEEPAEETTLDLLFDESTAFLHDLTDAFDSDDPIERIAATERAFGAPIALIGNWVWARTGNTR